MSHRWDLAWVPWLLQVTEPSIGGNESGSTLTELGLHKPPLIQTRYHLFLANIRRMKAIE